MIIWRSRLVNVCWNSQIWVFQFLEHQKYFCLQTRRMCFLLVTFWSFLLSKLYKLEFRTVNISEHIKYFFLWFSFSTLISEHVKEDFPGPKTFLGVSRNSSIDLHSNSRRNTAWIEQIPDRNKSPDGNKINTLSTVRLLTGPVLSLMSEHDCERDCKQTNKINGRLNETLANGS